MEDLVENVNILMGDLNTQIGKDRRGYEEMIRNNFGYGSRNVEGEDCCRETEEDEEWKVFGTR